MPDTWEGKDRRKTNTVCNLHCLLVDKITQGNLKSEETHKAIYGNGDPTKGLYWMVEQNTQFISTIRKVFWPMVTASLIGVLSAFFTFLKDVFFHVISK